MESVGQKLRAARLRLGLTLDQVSASTRITLRSLSALEADAVEQISSRFLYKSFVRQFAEAVGLDTEELRAELDAAVARIPESLVPGQDGAPVPPRVPGLRASRVRFSRWVSSLTLLIAMLAVCSTLYAVWKNSRGAVLQASIASFHWGVHRDTPAAPPKAPARPAVNAASVPAKASQPGPAPVRVEVCALERTWLSAFADGKEVYTGTLQASESKVLESQQTERIRTGNAGGVEIVFNGKKLGALGSRGQVETVEFEKNGYHIVQPSEHLAFAALRLTPDGFGQ